MGHEAHARRARRLLRAGYQRCMDAAGDESPTARNVERVRRAAFAPIHAWASKSAARRRWLARAARETGIRMRTEVGP